MVGLSCHGLESEERRNERREANRIGATGAGLQAGGKTDQIKNGERIVKIGLLIQILFFGLFVFTSIIFHQRLSHQPTRKIVEKPVPWKKHMLALYLSSGLIFVRSVFRLIEYNQGSEGEFRILVKRLLVDAYLERVILT